MKQISLILCLLLAGITSVVYATTTQEILSKIKLENKEYDIENKKWIFVKPKLKLRKSKFHAGTPVSHPAAKTLSTFELYGLLASKDDAITINALKGKEKIDVIYGGYWVKDIAGAKESHTEKLGKALNQIASNKSAPIVFYCMSAECWNSYNAVIHAHKLGYSDLYWYRGGINAWKDAGLPIQRVESFKIE